MNNWGQALSFLAFWAQLFEGGVALPTFLFPKFHSIFSHNFLYSLLEYSVVRQKELNWIFFLSLHLWIQISHF